MSATIISRTISSLVDKKLVLANDHASRTVGISTTWNTIRFAMRLRIDTGGLTTDISGGKLLVGVSSGTANVPGTPSTDNFIGVGNGDAGQDYTYNAGAPAYFSTGMNFAKRRGSTTTTGSSVSPYFAGDANVRGGFLVEITKGSPNYTVGFVFPGGATGAQTDLPYSALVSALEAATLTAAATALNAVVSGYSNFSATLATDETTGAFDSFAIMWSIASRPLEISEVLYARIA